MSIAFAGDYWTSETGGSREMMQHHDPHDETATNQGLWHLQVNSRVLSKRQWHFGRSGRPAMLNSDDLIASLQAQREAGPPNQRFFDQPVAADFPRPQLAMPDQALHPDYLAVPPFWKICSRRFREALAQPPETVEYIPVDLVAGSQGAWVKDYALMHVLAWDDVMDLARSDYTPTEGVDPATGQSRPEAAHLWQVALRPDARPRHEVFNLDRTLGTIFVTDAVAERVLRARCTGAAFYDPTWPAFSNAYRIRTADGAAVIE